MGPAQCPRPPCGCGLARHRFFGPVFSRGGPLYQGARASGFAAKPVGCGVSMAPKPSCFLGLPFTFHRTWGPGPASIDVYGLQSCTLPIVQSLSRRHGAVLPAVFFSMYLQQPLAARKDAGRKQQSAAKEYGVICPRAESRTSSISTQSHQEQPRTRRRFTPSPQPTLRRPCPDEAAPAQAAKRDEWPLFAPSQWPASSTPSSRPPLCDPRKSVDGGQSRQRGGEGVREPLKIALVSLTTL